MSDSRPDPREESSRPTPDEVDAWAARERARREAWLAGPSDDEKREWARRFRTRSCGLAGEPEPELGESAQRVLREVELAAKGGLEALLQAPVAVWSYLVRSGRRFEDDGYQPPPKGRVRF